MNKSVRFTKKGEIGIITQGKVYSKNIYHTKSGRKNIILGWDKVFGENNYSLRIYPDYIEPVYRDHNLCSIASSKELFRIGVTVPSYYKWIPGPVAEDYFIGSVYESGSYYAYSERELSDLADNCGYACVKRSNDRYTQYAYIKNESRVDSKTVFYKYKAEAIAVMIIDMYRKGLITIDRINKSIDNIEY